MRRDPAVTLRRTFFTLSGDVPEAQRWNPDLPEGGFLASLAEPAALPAWLPEAELALYAETYRRTGFRGGLNWYRNIERNWMLMAPFAGARIQVPALFVAGRRDPVLGWAGRAMEALPQAVPGLLGTVLVETAGHWVQQEAAPEVNAALLGFLKGL
ncbi:alpha/beta fold hydrolase [Dankookia sp. P2]|uniref:alpha/beta fold hydrolase n=1 Tax=Dankookia sp. P2 TaxID=3423955 RepID=UPI003D67885E